MAQRACPRKLPNAPVCCFAELCLRPWNPREHRVRPRLRTVSHAVMSVEPVDVGAADAVQVRVTRHNEIVPGIQPPGGIRRVPTAVVVEETPELKVNTCLQVHAAECAFIPHPRCPQALYHELGGERRVHGAQKGPVAGRPQRKGRGHATAGVRRLVEKASASRLKLSPTASSRRSTDGRQSRSPTRRQRSPKRGQRSPTRGRKAQEPGSPRSTGITAGRDLYVQGGYASASVLRLSRVRARGYSRRVAVRVCMCVCVRALVVVWL